MLEGVKKECIACMRTAEDTDLCLFASYTVGVCRRACRRFDEIREQFKSDDLNRFQRMR